MFGIIKGGFVKPNTALRLNLTSRLRHLSTARTLQRLNEILSEPRKSQSRDIIEALHQFSSKYSSTDPDSEIRRQMINSQDFLKFLSFCVKEIQMFSPNELCSLIYCTTIELGWRDHTLLRLLEPKLATSMDQLDAADIVSLIESYSKLRCGSRPFWEMLISSLISFIDRGELNEPSKIIRILRCISADESSKFYKPILVLRHLFPLLANQQPSSISECADIISAYSRWPKAANSREDLHNLISDSLGRISEPEIASDFHSAIRILRSLNSHIFSPDERIVLNRFVDMIRAIDLPTRIAADLKPMDKLTLVSSLYKSQICMEDKFLFSTLHDQLVPVVYQVPGSKLGLMAQIFSKCFGLINTFKFVQVNFGPINGETIPPILYSIADRCVKEGTMSKTMSIRELVRLGDAMANVRINYPEFWASYCMTLEGFVSGSNAADFSELSPEELGQLAFTIAEMGLEVSQDVRNNMVMVIFEKIHLMDKCFNTLLFFFHTCFEEDESISLITQLIELADKDKLCEDGTLVLGHMVLRGLGDTNGDLENFLKETEEDVGSFWSNASLTVDRKVYDSIDSGLGKELGSDVVVERSVTTRGCLVDFYVPSLKLAILVSSPLQLIGRDTPTGTALLRHRFAASVLPQGVKISNLSAIEWNETNQQERVDLVKALGNRKDHISESDTDRSKKAVVTIDDIEDDFGTADDDLSPFIQKDRHAAHRRRGPPNTSLPWVPSVFSLKQKPRRRQSSIT